MYVSLLPCEVNRPLNMEINPQYIDNWKSGTLFKYYEKNVSLFCWCYLEAPI